MFQELTGLDKKWIIELRKKLQANHCDFNRPFDLRRRSEGALAEPDIFNIIITEVRNNGIVVVMASDTKNGSRKRMEIHVNQFSQLDYQ